MTQVQEHDQDSGENYQLWLTERNLMLRSEHETAGSFDKAILTVSGGALVLSATFLDKFGPIGRGTSIWPLIVSWVALALSIVCIVVSFMTSQWAFHKYTDNLEKTLLEGSSEGSTTNPSRTVTLALNYSAMILTIIGIAFLVVAGIQGLLNGGD